MKQEYNVIIVGGGAAGLYIAGLLGTHINGVCLVDLRHDLLNVSFHTLGSFIEIEKFGLSPKIIASRITEVFVHSKHVHAKKTGNAYILDKAQLHKELLEKAAANNVLIKTSTRVKKARLGGDGGINSIIDDKNQEYSAQVFIDASGATGVLSKQCGLQNSKTNIAVGLEYNVKRFIPQNQAHLFIGKDFKGGYGWIFPLKNERAIAGFATFNRTMVTHIKDVFDAILAGPQMNTLVKKDNDQPCGGTIPITNVKKRFVYKNMIAIGDSISQVNPLVGEGYRFVLEAGRIAAPYILDALKNNNMQLLKGYEKEWNKTFYKSYKISKLLQRIANVVSMNDIAADAAIGLVSLASNALFSKFLRGFT